jgi:predicted helicase
MPLALQHQGNKGGHLLLRIRTPPLAGLPHPIRRRSQEIPSRIPFADRPADFWSFSKAGRELAQLHLDYEAVPPCPDVVVAGEESGNFRVERMAYLNKGDKSAIQYNAGIRISNIPLAAYDYIVNGKSAIDWVMERYQVKTDKASQIRNDPNDWGLEHGQPRYVLDLLLSVINVSVRTMEIVAGLPALD